MVTRANPANPSAASSEAASPGTLQRRHALPVRVTHWLNVVILVVMLGSGLAIFNAYPELHWGRASGSSASAVLEITMAQRADGRWVGLTRVMGLEFETTGILGLSYERDGQLAGRAFPWWLTIPSAQWLAMARSWHFAFAWLLCANGLAYLGWTLFSGHLRRDLLPRRGDLAELRRVRGSGRSGGSAGGTGGAPLSGTGPASPRSPGPRAAAPRYNVVQKVLYLGVVLVLLPMLVLTGLGMSPWANAALPGWIDLLGGRQSARTLHFAGALLLVGFVALHVAATFASGPLNLLRGMITGHCRVRAEQDRG